MKHPRLRSKTVITTTFKGMKLIYHFFLNTCLLPGFNWLRPYPEGYSNKRKKRGWTENIRALHGTLFLFGTDGYGFQEPRVQMVRGYGFHITGVGTWTVPEKLGLPRFDLRSLVKSAIWLRSGLRIQGRFRSGLHSTSFFPNCDISHAFNFRHAFTASYKLFYISTSTVSPAAASCPDCTS